MYLRRHGWTDADRFSIQTAAGEIRPHITGPDTCTLDMGRARTRSEDYPERRATTGRGELEAGGRTWRFQHVAVGNPQCAIHVADVAELDALDLGRDRPGDQAARAVSQPHERLLVRRARAGRHPRADLRARRGGDDVLRDRRQRRRDRLRRCAAATRP